MDRAIRDGVTLNGNAVALVQTNGNAVALLQTNGNAVALLQIILTEGTKPCMNN
jgi:hypothetical protein